MDKTYRQPLIGLPEEAETMSSAVCSNDDNHGTMTVVGNTLFYYTFAGRQSVNSLPRLSSIVFREWAQDKSPQDLVEYGLRSYDILGYKGTYHWIGIHSPIYPSGFNAITMSVNGNDAWAVDAVIDTTARITSELVHYGPCSAPVLATANRDIATFPGYTCRAFFNGSHKCAPISPGRYTWEEEGEIVQELGRFIPLERKFAIPLTLWVMYGTIRDFLFSPLVGSGNAPILGFTGDVLVEIETLPDPGCASGRRLYLMRRAVPDMTELSREPLNCEWRQVLTQVGDRDVVYGALPVKWVGPWSDGVLLTGVSITTGEYHLRGAPELPWSGDSSTDHVLFSSYGSAMWGTVQFRKERTLMDCHLVGWLRTPGDIDIASGALVASRRDCLDLVVPSPISANSKYEGLPLLAYASSPTMMERLLELGADSNMKGNDGRTPLCGMMFFGWVDNDIMRSIALLIGTGAAVCTWPRNPLMEDVVEKDPRRAMIASVSHVAPCEPGFFLTGALLCSGLTPCPAGSFCPGWHQNTSKAHPCPAGTYRSVAGAISIAQCQPCPPQRPYSAPGSCDPSECVSFATEPVYGVDEVVKCAGSTGTSDLSTPLVAAAEPLIRTSMDN